MVRLALIERELRVALRKLHPVKTRLRTAALASATAAFLFLVGEWVHSNRVGGVLAPALCLAGVILILRTPALTAGIFANERRDQTLGLLFISGLSASEVFLSKLLSSALIAFTDLLAIYPLMALPFLVGGISFDLFLAITAALPAAMLLALSLSLLASVLSRDEGTAVTLTTVFAALLCLATPIIYYANTHFTPGGAASIWWLRLSPGYGAHLIANGLSGTFGPLEIHEFWLNLAVSLGWSLFFLAAASVRLSALWRDQAEARENSSWQLRVQGFIHGTRQSRERLGQTWLKANPFVWLAGHDLQPVRVTWLVLGGISVVWLLGWAAWPAHWASAPNFFITATLMNSALAWSIHYTAARNLAEPRANGAYEMLLTTPLEPSDMVWGGLEALRWQFLPLLRSVFGLECLMALGGLATRKWTPSALAVYFFIWFILLFWTWRLARNWSRALLAMWAGLNCARPAHAVWKTAGFSGWSWIWIVFQFRNLSRGISKLATFPTGSRFELVMTGIILCVWLILWLLYRNSSLEEADRREHRLIREFREIVREPIPEPHHPQYKQWDARERFPWGFYRIQEQLHERLVRMQGRQNERVTDR
jgi:ABC-type transport system involved in multi-copper enzyme maturation permease subunit